MIAPYTRPDLPDSRIVAEQVASPPLTEAELLDLMRKHCQKSWQATRWLLETQFPERYGKRKANAAPAANLEELFNALGDVLSEEIADEALRQRITARLDAVAAAGPTLHKPALAAESKANRAAAAQPLANDHGRSSMHPQQQQDLKQQEDRNPPKDSPVNGWQTADTTVPDPSAADAPPAHGTAPPAPIPAGPHDARTATPAKTLTPLPAALDAPRPPLSWMERARQQNEERKRLRKQRNQIRAQQAALRSQNKRGQASS